MKRVLFMMALLCATMSLSAQTADKAVYTVDKHIPAYVFSPQANVGGAKKARAKAGKAEDSYLRSVLNLNSETSAQQTDTLTDMAGGFHVSYKEYYKGVAVENTRCIIHYDSLGNVTLVNGNFRTVEGLSVEPVLSEANALQAALQAVGAEKYAWEDEASEQFIKLVTDDEQATNYPQGSLVVYVKGDVPYLVYKFAIHAVSPEQDLNVYVDAASGNVIDQMSNVNHVSATVQTLYSGQREIETYYQYSSYWLKDYTRGNGIITSKYNNLLLIDSYNSTDNTWADMSTHDRAALDAHWGAEMTYDFYLSKFGRNSYDNQGSVIKSFVNASGLWTARWNMSNKVMLTGISLGTGKPYVSLDAVAHELTHGVTQATSGLGSIGESGAINEGLSDVFAVCVENYATPEKGDSIWLIAEDVSVDGERSVKNPACKYYKGSAWNNLSELHDRAGVFDYWFYLLATDGEPDLTPPSPNMPPLPSNGLGLDLAIQICYLMNAAYLTPTSGYEDARICSQAAAIALNLPNLAMNQINSCWDAVGVTNKTSIQGPDIVFRTGEFYIQDMPEGATVEWSTQNSTTGIIPLNDEGTRVMYTCPMFDSPTYIDDVITATVSYVFGPQMSATISSKSKTVRVYGHPQITDIELSIDNIVNVVTTAGSTFYIEANWSGERTLGNESGTITFTDIPYPDDVAYAGRAECFRQVVVSKTGYYNISAEIDNGDGPFTKMFYLYSNLPSGINVAPNPASDVVTLTLPEASVEDGIAMGTLQQSALKSNSVGDEFQVQLWSESTIVRRATGTGNSCQLSVAGLPSGMYYVVVVKNGETYRQKLIVK